MSDYKAKQKQINFWSRASLVMFIVYAAMSIVFMTFDMDISTSGNSFQRAIQTAQQLFSQHPYYVGLYSGVAVITTVVVCRYSILCRR